MTTRTHLFVAALSIAVALWPLQARAQTSTQTSPSSQASGSFDPINTRIVSDPLYLPLKGQIYGVTAYTLDMPKGDNFKAGVSTGSFQASDNLVDQTVAYGLFNDLTLRLAMGYGVNKRDSTAAATGDVTTGNASGFNDPTLSATYRALDETRSLVILDLTASYSPDAIDSKSSGGGSDGTLGRGGSNTGISLAIGREMKSFTIAGTAATTYVGQQATDLLASNTTSESDAHWSYNLALTTQTRFNERMSLNAGVGYATAGDYNVSNIDTGNSHTYSGPNTRTLNIALNYHFCPNRLVGAFTYTYNSYTEATNTFAKATSDTSVENRTGNVVGVRLMYVFN